MNYTFMILGMVAVTVFIKTVILMFGNRIVLPPFLKQALSFVPVTVLTAIIVPMILAPHGGGLEMTWRNPQLVAASAAAFISAATKRQLLTIGVGLAVFFAWRFWVSG